MKNHDKDGKAQTSSAVDSARYPHPADTNQGNEEKKDRHPTHEQIAEQAHRIWVSRGCPDGSAGADWLEAETELANATVGRALVRDANDKGGSVQP